VPDLGVAPASISDAWILLQITEIINTYGFRAWLLFYHENR